MRSLLLSALLVMLLSSCKDDAVEDNPTEFFSISITPKLDVLNIADEGRTSTGDSIYYTDVFYSIYDSQCENIVQEGSMLNSTTIPELVFPELAGGQYFFNVEVRGSQSIAYDSAASFVLQSDTTIELLLTNKQFRYSFKDVSDFNDPEVSFVKYFLNYSTKYIPNLNKCTDELVWTPENYEGSAEGLTYYPHVLKHYQYDYPIDVESFQVKFFNSNGFLIKSHVIPLSKKLLKHHSYTFEVDLSTIWNDVSAGNRIDVNVEDVAWTEEVIQVN